jgi:hypothetical protein
VGQAAGAWIGSNAIDPRKNPDVRFAYIDISSIDRTTKMIVSPAALAGKDAPKPILKWDVHFEGLQDYRKDPNTTAADQ